MSDSTLGLEIITYINRSISAFAGELTLRFVVDHKRVFLSVPRENPIGQGLVGHVEGFDRVPCYVNIHTAHLAQKAVDK